MNDFDLIAPLYDFLARLVFGNVLLNSQTAFLKEIQNGDRVLVLGGGTGRLLEHISADNVVIDYVEPSTKMIERAKKRKCSCEVEFHHQRFEVYQSIGQYDVILCPFFLDLFSDPHLNEVLLKVQGLLKPKGKLIVSDFSSEAKGPYSKLLFKVMHSFFRWAAQIESRELLDHDHFVQAQGFEVMKEASFLNGMVYSRTYVRS